MWVLILEALAALGLLLFIVWWTMFAGRHRGERPGERPGERDPEPDAGLGPQPDPERDDQAG